MWKMKNEKYGLHLSSKDYTRKCKLVFFTFHYLFKVYSLLNKFHCIRCDHQLLVGWDYYNLNL